MELSTINISRAPELGLTQPSVPIAMLAQATISNKISKYDASYLHITVLNSTCYQVRLMLSKLAISFPSAYRGHQRNRNNKLIRLYLQLVSVYLFSHNLLSMETQGHFPLVCRFF